jgi:hypothetical protein
VIVQELVWGQRICYPRNYDFYMCAHAGMIVSGEPYLCSLMPVLANCVRGGFVPSLMRPSDALCCIDKGNYMYLASYMRRCACSCVCTMRSSTLQGVYGRPLSSLFVSAVRFALRFGLHCILSASACPCSASMCRFFSFGALNPDPALPSSVACGHQEMELIITWGPAGPKESRPWSRQRFLLLSRVCRPTASLVGPFPPCCKNDVLSILYVFTRIIK